MADPIRVLFLDDHQAVLDGYQYRLSNAPDIQITSLLMYGEDLEPTLAQQAVDVILLDLSVPISPTNSNPYPILYLIPKLLDTYPHLVILIISMHEQRALVRSLLEAGISGYILKDDRVAMLDLAGIIRLVQGGGVYFSQKIARALRPKPDEAQTLLTPRQLEVLSYAAAYPELNSDQLSQKLNIAPSTLRNLLSGAYVRLEVPNRSAALAKARQLGLLSPDA